MILVQEHFKQEHLLAHELRLDSAKVKVFKCNLADVLVVKNQPFLDERGYFQEVLRASDFSKITQGKSLCQINQSFSKQKVFRGFHYQYPKAQGKLLQVLQGAILDVIIDIRQSSPSFMQTESFVLSELDHSMLYIPEGFAHAFVVISEQALVQYYCTEFYEPQDACSLNYQDPVISCQWQHDFALLLHIYQQYGLTALNEVKEIILKQESKLLSQKEFMLISDQSCLDLIVSSSDRQAKYLKDLPLFN